MKKKTSAPHGLESRPRSGGSGALGMAVFCLCFVFDAGMPAQQRETAGPGDSAKPTFTMFDAPGAGTGAGQGTNPTSINAAGVIAGTYNGAAPSPLNVYGFVRAADGAITDFVAPGGNDTIGTYASAVNAAGTLTGYYLNYVYPEEGPPVLLAFGLVRASDGTLTTLSAPDAGTGPSTPAQGTYSLSINTRGDLAGYYIDANIAAHGFVRSAGGTFTSFDAPGAGTAKPFPKALTPWGLSRDTT